MTQMTAYWGADIFDGEATHQNQALVCENGYVSAIVPRAEIPASAMLETFEGGLLAPAYVDLQVNGGGGVLLNEQPDLAGIRTICDTHRQFGTGALLPTLITDTPEVISAAIDAGIEAHRAGVKGFLGLHMEGPFLAAEKKGAHAGGLIRPMEETDLLQLVEARKNLPNLLVTVAPSAVSSSQIQRLTQAGIIVSLGHSNASFSEAEQAADAGATCATHLFNAMSPFNHREPGMVGAALNIGTLNCGLIADGFHVAPQAIATALAAKQGPGSIFLVTDAMSCVGTDVEEFYLNGRRILRSKGRLTLEDGTLAGADIDMHSSVRFMHEQVNIPFEECLRMASLYPARCMGIDGQFGHLKKGAIANMLYLTDENKLKRIVSAQS